MNSGKQSKLRQRGHSQAQFPDQKLAYGLVNGRQIYAHVNEQPFHQNTTPYQNQISNKRVSEQNPYYDPNARSFKNLESTEKKKKIRGF